MDAGAFASSCAFAVPAAVAYVLMDCSLHSAAGAFNLKQELKHKNMRPIVANSKAADCLSACLVARMSVCLSMVLCVYIYEFTYRYFYESLHLYVYAAMDPCTSARAYVGMHERMIVVSMHV